ncbi:MAG TPA: SUMF1/EgtB/PvdO family nonheme iron enzyme [Planctomycetaceae bacterium]|jgi:serine/threonine protein kinase/formylglycine-generating enzyme required for sulfatase activity|nr:SUMF1/EgtB/PvdO family nonheme iron enzyme [Planctomycetaceae bacterium]
MERQASVHPADETLVSYGLGKLDETLAESVNKHLEQCDPCRQRVAQLSSDSFVGRLREARPQPGHARLRPKTIAEPDPPLPSRAAGKQVSSVNPPVSNDALPPELADHPQYEVLRELGRGGMGVVYLARNKLMNRLEVLKVLNKEMLAKQGRADRFLREIQSAARLHHPNVVAAYAALQMGDLLVFCMEYVEGDDLAKLVRARGPLPIINACYFAYQAAQGLQHAHECGMIHRDIKPGNLILFRQGKKGIVKILDFGLAKVTSERGLDRTLTQEGQMLGTPDYIAPEQTLDAQKADIRADIYSLGCTLYHLLTGNTPFSGNSLFEVLQAHHSVEAKSLNLVRPDVPVELAAVVAKMMAKDPNRRYQTPAEVVQALKPFLKPGGLTGSQPELSRVASQADRPAPAVALAPTPGDDDDPHLAPMETVQPAERWQSLIDASQFDRSSARSAIRKRPRRQPHWMWPSVAVGAVLFGLVTAWASGIFSVKTKDGVIVLKNLPPDADVFVDKTMVVVTFPKGGAPAQVTVPPGSHEIQIKRGDITARGKHVTIANGGREEINVEFEPAPSHGSQQLVSKTGVSEPSQFAPTQPDMAQPKPPALLAAPFDEDAAKKRQERWAAHLGSKVEITNTVGMRMKLVPPGRFEMGSKESVDQLKAAFPVEAAANRPYLKFEGEWPVHEVTISRPFYLGKYEVTKRQFKQFVEEAGFRTDAERSEKGGRGFTIDGDKLSSGQRPNFTWRDLGVEQPDDAPVVNISHNDAAEFCEWLSKKERNNYRLPTEAEWEYACRAGTRDRYYNGDDPEGLTKIGNVRDATWLTRFQGWETDQPARSSSDGYVFPAPVGQFLPNNFGLYDMLGNSWEHCADWYDENYYLHSPDRDPPGPESGQNRVFRGGAWGAGAMQCRATRRNYRQPDLPWDNTGFRVALSVPEAESESQQRRPRSRSETGADSGFVPLFNGRDLTGWSDPLHNGSEWTVEQDGTVVGHASGMVGKPAVLETDRADFTDFTLSARIWRGLRGGRITFRSSFDGVSENGYGVAMGHDATANDQLRPIGTIDKAVDRRVGGNVTPVAVAQQQDVEGDDWYKLEVTAIARHVAVKVNGKTIAEYTDPAVHWRESGRILLCVRSDATIRIKDLRIRELSHDASGTGFAPLFNGKDFAGWTFPAGHPEKWTIENGVLRGAGEAYIATERSDFKDFHVRMSLRAPDEFNKLLVFRRNPGGAETYYRFDLGGVRASRTSVAPVGSYSIKTPTASRVSKDQLSELEFVNAPVPEKDKWHRVEIIGKGNTFRLLIDGQSISAFRDDASRLPSGGILIAIVDGARLELRDIEIKDLSSN